MQISNYDYEHRIQIEESILGSILVDNNGLNGDIMFKHGIDLPEYFREKKAQNLYSMILSCWENDMVPDLLTIGKFKHKFYKKGDKKTNDFDLYCITLTQRISSAAHLEHHLLLMKQYVLFDYWNTKVYEIQESNWNDRDVFIVSSNIIEGYSELEKKFTEGIQKSGGNLRDQQRDKWLKIQKGEYFTVPSTLTEYDEFTGGGFHPAEFTIIAGRPGMGKTSIAYAIAKDTCNNNGKKGIFLSLEMTKTQLINRVVASKMGMDYARVKSLQLTAHEFVELERQYDLFEKNSTLKVYDRNDYQTLSEIEKMIKEHDLDFVMIDYIQLITLDGKVKSKVGNREQEISEISKSLKAFSTIYDIPVIGLSQLSRAVEQRPNKRPMLSDLRESGSLEQDADNVIFFYRDAYYRKLSGQTVPYIEEGNFEMIQSKGRESGTEKFEFHIDFKTSEFSQYFRRNGDEEPSVPQIPKVPQVPQK